MAWIKVESSVARNRKFVKAGPAPSWLWLCGLAYCQEGLTDGFIPAEALDFLGVKNAKQLAAHLVAAGLWDVAEGGWRVHDYLEHNRSAADVDLIRHDRRQAGSRGGVASGMARRRKQDAKQDDSVCFDGAEANAKQVSKPSVAVAGSVAVAVADLKGRGAGETDPPMDVWLRELQAAYPSHRVSRNMRTEQAFVTAILGVSDGPVRAWALMQANLAANMASYEWRVKGMVPMLEKYLHDGLWLNVLPADAPAGEQLSAKTLRMLGAV